MMNKKEPHHPAIITDGIIFDLDGTLWDASETCAKAWNKALKESGNPIHAVDSSMIRSFSGLRIQTIFERHFSHIPSERHKDILALYIKYEGLLVSEWGGVLFPGAEQTLKALHKHWKLFIVSNCLSGYIENFLGFSHMQNYFQDAECSGNTGLSKAENIHLVIQRNNIKYPIYVGDTQWDHDASVENGIPFIYAAYGFGSIHNAFWQINRLEELPNMIRHD